MELELSQIRDTLTGMDLIWYDKCELLGLTVRLALVMKIRNVRGALISEEFKFPPSESQSCQEASDTDAGPLCFSSITWLNNVARHTEEAQIAKFAVSASIPGESMNPINWSVCRTTTPCPNVGILLLYWLLYLNGRSGRSPSD